MESKYSGIISPLYNIQKISSNTAINALFWVIRLERSALARLNGTAVSGYSKAFSKSMILSCFADVDSSFPNFDLPLLAFISIFFHHSKRGKASVVWLDRGILCQSIQACLPQISDVSFCHLVRRQVSLLPIQNQLEFQSWGCTAYLCLNSDRRDWCTLTSIRAAISALSSQTIEYLMAAAVCVSHLEHQCWKSFASKLYSLIVGHDSTSTSILNLHLQRKT